MAVQSNPRFHRLSPYDALVFGSNHVGVYQFSPFPVYGRGMARERASAKKFCLKNGQCIEVAPFDQSAALVLTEKKGKSGTYSACRAKIHRGPCGTVV